MSGECERLRQGAGGGRRKRPAARQESAGAGRRADGQGGGSGSNTTKQSVTSAGAFSSVKSGMWVFALGERGSEQPRACGAQQERAGGAGVCKTVGWFQKKMTDRKKGIFQCSNWE